ncbi:hypothetical protein [Myxococcus xanthus]|uniref:hypothetical protein n=1 Tax=Myxococcus xanthus TaxID=34 RepID=UPI001126F57C|nr:hypothetical protein [Myxococcus xanthus]
MKTGDERRIRDTLFVNGGSYVDAITPRVIIPSPLSFDVKAVSDDSWRHGRAMARGWRCGVSPSHSFKVQRKNVDVYRRCPLALVMVHMVLPVNPEPWSLSPYCD